MTMHLAERRAVLARVFDRAAANVENLTVERVGDELVWTIEEGPVTVTTPALRADAPAWMFAWLRDVACASLTGSCECGAVQDLDDTSVPLKHTGSCSLVPSSEPVSRYLIHKEVERC